MSIKQIVSLDEAVEDCSSDLCGNKAFNLLRFKKHPHLSKLASVSDGFVILTDLFEEIYNAELGYLNLMQKTFKYSGYFSLRNAELLEAQARKKIESTQLSVQEITTKITAIFPAIFRSSATIEDSVNKSFAGQFTSIPNVKPETKEVSLALAHVYHSFFRPTNIEEMVIGEKENPKMAILLQKMINTQYSGVFFSEDPLENGLLMEYIEGQNNLLVGGNITPNRIKKESEIKEDALKSIFINLQDISKRLEDLDGRPVDIEWGYNGSLYIFQFRNIAAKKTVREILDFSEFQLLNRGIPCSGGVVSGKLFLLRSEEDHYKLKNCKERKIVYVNELRPELSTILPYVSGIISKIGGALAHISILCRERGIPCVSDIQELNINPEENIILDGGVGNIYRSDITCPEINKSNDTIPQSNNNLNIERSFLDKFTFQNIL